MGTTGKEVWNRGFREQGCQRVYLQFRDIEDIGQIELVGEEALPHV